MTATSETVLAVHEKADGYWYIGEGRSIAQGPFRNPQQLLAVATDLLASTPKWRIEVFDVAGVKITSLSSEDTDVGALRPLSGRGQWTTFTHGSRH